MTKKQFLNQTRILDAQIQSKSDQIAILEARATRCTQQFSDMPSGSLDPHSAENLLVKIIELKDELRREWADLQIVWCDVRDAINTLENPIHRTVLEHRYLSFLSVEQTAEKMGFSSMHIYRLTNQAIKFLKM